MASRSLVSALSSSTHSTAAPERDRPAAGGRKLRTLQRAGVPHSWLVDPGNKTLTVLRFTPDGYLAPLTAGGSDVIRAEPFDAIEIDLGRVFDDGTQESPSEPR